VYRILTDTLVTNNHITSETWWTIVRLLRKWGVW